MAMESLEYESVSYPLGVQTLTDTVTFRSVFLLDKTKGGKSPPFSDKWKKTLQKVSALTARNAQCRLSSLIKTKLSVRPLNRSENVTCNSQS